MGVLFDVATNKKSGLLPASLVPRDLHGASTSVVAKPSIRSEPASPETSRHIWKELHAAAAGYCLDGDGGSRLQGRGGSRGEMAGTSLPGQHEQRCDDVRERLAAVRDRCWPDISI